MVYNAQYSNKRHPRWFRVYYSKVGGFFDCRGGEEFFSKIYDQPFSEFLLRLSTSRSAPRWFFGSKTFNNDVIAQTGYPLFGWPYLLLNVKEAEQNKKNLYV